LPPDAATTPAAGISRLSRLLNAPRALNEPECCSSSSFSTSSPGGRPKSARSTVITGVRRTYGAIRSAAAAIPAAVTVPAGPVSCSSTLVICRLLLVNPRC
jgi:hypothetical protein